MLTPFYYTKVGFKEVKIIQACFRDVWWMCGSVDPDQTPHSTQACLYV